MSRVTTIVLVADEDDAPNVREYLARWLNKEGYGSFHEVNDCVGGHKTPEVDIWAGAFNHLDVDELVGRFHAISWKQPHDVMLVLNTNGVTSTIGAWAKGSVRRP